MSTLEKKLEKEVNESSAPEIPSAFDSVGALNENLERLRAKKAAEAAARRRAEPEPVDATALFSRYAYLPDLTEQIEARVEALSEDESPDRSMVYEMILWKLSRFVWFDDEALSQLSAARTIAPGQHRQAEPLLRALLSAKGARLPMASTFLRFVNPKAFQIIDERAFRMVLPDEEIPKPGVGPRTKGYLDRCCTLYFRYLDALHAISSEELPFSKSDRVLYQLDKELGNGVGQRRPRKDADAAQDETNE
ncbi:hypothetical protein [Burkholderia pseudomallei]|uniref:hypothetical protein n=1 Tax=Burkholderia pseudomallei TaxID=28450 RepID=UPI000F090AD8|nr:hypothetical protein [Burkholderia pseudomallei]CAJ3074542.1 Uncharacterised protein [Burkholderia pseudomallei]VCK72718.1 Uncharacterised protein [Burkholderia pseudomallei]VCK79950.1 Uncharacterised protein [Burkholderia pseudomallei]VCK80061.1 Uncharacterised protein [Burkholderia pseudomallei]VCK80731.1 Uncharacterised protein [Burkholderia pseudomallei]